MVKQNFIIPQIIIILQCLLFGHLSYAQKNVAITIDDVPNTRQYKTDNYQSILLNKIDSMKVPVAIFINEGLIYKTDAIEKNKDLLLDWCWLENVTLGNHTYSHLRYSETDLTKYISDIENGELIMNTIINDDKAMKHFRFPYNDLGKDSLQQATIASILKSKNYRITPFTIESSDYMFNLIYTNHLSKGELKEAQEIGDLYVAKTIDFFNFYDSLSQQIYGRSIDQIYLCHDNALNAKYLPELINQLQISNYSFISLDVAIEDPAYSQENIYYKKWGISWFYRWMKTSEERKKWMLLEPSLKNVEEEYDALIQKQ